jgi:hypothetical protein
MAKRQTRVLSARCAFFAYLLLPVALLQSTFLANSGYAQSTFGDIRGTVRDPSNLALPQAEVTLHNVDENTNRTTTSDDSGGYLFENLKPSHYTVSAAKTGFAASSTVALELTARQSARVDVSRSIPRTLRSATPGVPTNWSRCRSISEPRPPVRWLRWPFPRAS